MCVCMGRSAAEGFGPLTPPPLFSFWHVQNSGQTNTSPRVRHLARLDETKRFRPTLVVHVFVHRRFVREARLVQMSSCCFSTEDASRCFGTVWQRVTPPPPPAPFLISLCVDSLHVLISSTGCIKNKVTFCLVDVFAEKTLKPSGMRVGGKKIPLPGSCTEWLCLCWPGWLAGWLECWSCFCFVVLPATC